MKVFIKQICFVVMMQALAAIFIGAFLLMENAMLGISVLAGGTLLKIASIILASHYHKQNIHLNVLGFAAGMILFVTTLIIFFTALS